MLTQQHTQSPAEKVILWAQNVDKNIDSLFAEADRVEGLLAQQEENPEGPGAELSLQVVEVLESHLDGVYGLLDYAEEPCDELLQECLASLLRSHSLMQELEDQIEATKHAVPLIA